MKVRCTKCNEMVNVSIEQHIPKTGYICPNCNNGIKRKQRKFNKFFTEEYL